MIGTTFNMNRCFLADIELRLARFSCVSFQRLSLTGVEISLVPSAPRTLNGSVKCMITSDVVSLNLEEDKRKILTGKDEL